MTKSEHCYVESAYYDHGDKLKVFIFSPRQDMAQTMIKKLYAAPNVKVVVRCFLLFEIEFFKLLTVYRG